MIDDGETGCDCGFVSGCGLCHESQFCDTDIDCDDDLQCSVWGTCIPPLSDSTTSYAEFDMALSTGGSGGSTLLGRCALEDSAALDIIRFAVSDAMNRTGLSVGVDDVIITGVDNGTTSDGATTFLTVSCLVQLNSNDDSTTLSNSVQSAIGLLLSTNGGAGGGGGGSALLSLLQAAGIPTTNITQAAASGTGTGNSSSSSVPVTPVQPGTQPFIRPPPSSSNADTTTKIVASVVVLGVAALAAAAFIGWYVRKQHSAPPASPANSRGSGSKGDAPDADATAVEMVKLTANVGESANEGAAGAGGPTSVTERASAPGSRIVELPAVHSPAKSESSADHVELSVAPIRVFDNPMMTPTVREGIRKSIAVGAQSPILVPSKSDE